MDENHNPLAPFIKGELKRYHLSVPLRKGN
jgi:hypothetical protein